MARCTCGEPLCPICHPEQQDLEPWDDKMAMLTAHEDAEMQAAATQAMIAAYTRPPRLLGLRRALLIFLLVMLGGMIGGMFSLLTFTYYN